MIRRASALALLGLSGIFLATAAEARPDLRKMTCAKAQSLVRQHGAVVFTTGQYTYSRFVANINFCDWDQVLALQYGPTRDARRCPVAYECVEPMRPWLFRRN